MSQTEDAAVKASGSDPHLSQALLGANLALSLVLGNGGAAVEVGGATADLTTREVPDLGSLLGGSKLPPLPGGESGGGSVPGDGGLVGAEGGSDVSTGVGNRPSDRLTFSPRANLTPFGLPVSSSSFDGRPYLSLMTASCPPITLALPCSRRAVVTPPARAR